MEDFPSKKNSGTVEISILQYVFEINYFNLPGNFLIYNAYQKFTACSEWYFTYIFCTVHTDFRQHPGRSRPWLFCL